MCSSYAGAQISTSASRPKISSDILSDSSPTRSSSPPCSSEILQDKESSYPSTSSSRSQQRLDDSSSSSDNFDLSLEAFRSPDSSSISNNCGITPPQCSLELSKSFETIEITRYRYSTRRMTMSTLVNSILCCSFL